MEIVDIGLGFVHELIMLIVLHNHFDFNILILKYVYNRLTYGNVDSTRQYD